jgi:glucose-1-phosphate cytidylyltransferase
VSDDNNGLVTALTDIQNSNIRINGGFYTFRPEIFDYIHHGEELVREPFQRLIAKKELMAVRYDGFFVAMDTFKDKLHLEELYSGGQAPWELWKRSDASVAGAKAKGQASHNGDDQL